ncbi:glycoside hydrolase family 3 protein [Paenibacillus tengchongensis]|uniref:glycoside hydrolase family 3 protein n=1 Tax=Paenibacillus tengchongensis TaxID=2608684 RepID=UPI001FE7175C|nr:glycoside hydrolase family 3 protein [Paenibacillus tengchongensis]
MKRTETDFRTLPMWNAELPLEQRLDDLLDRLTLEDKIGLMPTRQEAVPRLGITEYWVGGEAAHGFVAQDGPATVFPQTIGLSSTWNPELLQEIGSVIGDEARSYYRQRGGLSGLTVWAPTVDMERDPRWGRTEEAYGEDPHLTGVLATSLIQGMHGEHPYYIKLAPALKHFYANNNERERLRSSSSVDPRNRREYYLKAFERAVTEGRVHSLMTSYNSINGTPAIGHPDVKGVLKEEWRLDGFIVSDGGDMSMTVSEHGYCRTYAEAVAFAIKGGIDCVTDDSVLVKNSIREALEQGLLTEAELDCAIRNVFRIRFRLGQFDPDELNPYAQIAETVIHHPAHRETALKAAREAIVLLKNEAGLLPLRPDAIRRAAVIGPLADTVYRDWYTGHPPYTVSPLQGIVAALPDARVDFRDGDDRVYLRSVRTDRYVGTKGWGNGLLVADREHPSAGERFRRTDWGWGANTLRSHANGNYVTADDKGGRLAAEARDIWGWFVKERLELVPGADGTTGIRTWSGRSVSVDDASPDHELVLAPWIAPGAGGADGTDSADAIGGSEAIDGATAADSEGHGGGQPHPDCPFTVETASSGIGEAVEIAKAADVALVFAGNHPLLNGKEEIDRPGLTLPEYQERLIRAVHEANPQTVLVIIGSYPYALGDLAELLPAILYTAHGSQELGTAVADVLLGRYNPAGRLSMTWYRSEEQLPDIMDYDIIKGKRTYQYFDGSPLYPFGYGLSYSSFRYSGLTVAGERPAEGESFTVELTVENSGPLAGDEVVQLYVRAEESRVVRPQKQLIGFRRLHLQPGESRKLVFGIPVSELAYWDVTRDRYCVEACRYTLLAGASSEDIRLTAELPVQGETVPPRDLCGWTAAENYDDYEGLYLDEWKETGSLGDIEPVKGVCIRPAGAAAAAWAGYFDTAFPQEVSGFEAHVLSHGAGAIRVRLDSPEGPVAGELRIEGAAAGSRSGWHTAACPVRQMSAATRVVLELEGDIRVSRFRFVAEKDGDLN